MKFFLASSAHQLSASSYGVGSASPLLCAPILSPCLTRRSSRPAYGGRLTLAVSPITRFMRAATRSSAPPCSEGFLAFWASSACAASATSYPSCSAAPLSRPSGFSWAAHVFKAGRSLLAFGSNFAVKRTRILRAAYLGRCAVMKVLLLFAAINTLMPSTSWAETGLVADYPELPADARKVVERSAACRHFADEIAGNGSERDRQVNRQIKKLRCNTLENDANRIRQKYKSRPEVLRLMDESMA